MIADVDYELEVVDAPVVEATWHVKHVETLTGELGLLQGC